MEPKIYKDKRTKDFADGIFIKEFQSFEKQAHKRLDLLESATSKEDLMEVPGNHFKSLGGDRKNQYSIRINNKWRICFEWSEEKNRPIEIEIVDYH